MIKIAKKKKSEPLTKRQILKKKRQILKKQTVSELKRRISATKRELQKTKSPAKKRGLSAYLKSTEKSLNYWENDYP